MKTIVVAGTCSGVGKTSIALGLMAAYSRRGLRVQPFKVGPDFLDPLHHKAATGRESYNLDSWMLSRDANLTCFRRCVPNTDIAIVEGAMGLYDGYDGRSERGSTAEMAKFLCAPVLLILDCWALARSAAAMIHGYTTFDPEVKFAGVVFNKVCESAQTAWLTEAVSSTDSKVRIFGGIPKVTGIELPASHISPSDKEEDKSYIQKLADLIERHVDLDAVLEKAAECEQGKDIESTSNQRFYRSSSSIGIFSKQVRIGVARDAAFCFQYHENLALLEDAGAELVYFSPLKDSLPPRLGAIYFGGGCLEPYLDKLSANKQLLYAVRAFADAGGLIYGESGGLMYLSQGVEETQTFPMCRVFPFWTRVGQPSKTGYVKVTPQGNCAIFPAEVGEIRGFTYSGSDIFWPDGSFIGSCTKWFSAEHKEGMLNVVLEGYMQANAIASSVHLHFGSNPDIAYNFVEICRMDRMKAAAVAAASASAVAGAGPVAAAAAGAAAAAAVAAAMGESGGMFPYNDSRTILSEMETSYQNLKWFGGNRMVLPSKHVDSLKASESGTSQEQVMLRRSESFDLNTLRRKISMTAGSCGISRSESESWDGLAELHSDDEGLKIQYKKCLSTRGTLDDINLVLRKKDAKYARGKSSSVDFRDLKLLSPNRNRERVHDSRPMGESFRLCGPSYPAEVSSSLSLRNMYRWSCNGNASQELKYLHFGSPSTSYRTGSLTQRAKFPKKIVSLLPSATEILMELGAGNWLIAITDSCDIPSGVQIGRHIVSRSKLDSGTVSSRNVETAGEWKPYLGSLRRKAGRLRPDISWLAKVKPDLILTEENNEQLGNDNSTITVALAQAGLSSENIRILTLGPHTVAEVMASILELGDAVGLYVEACLLVDLLRARLRKVAAAVALQRKPRMLLLQGLDPLFLGGHWIPEIEMLAGGFDGLQKPGCSVEMLHWQRIISYGPEVLVLAPCSYSMDQTLSEVELLARLHGFWSIPAVEAGRVYICEHSCFSCPGPRIANGVELLACILHPFATTDIHIQEAVWKLNLNYGQRCSPQDLRKYFKQGL